MTPPGVQPQPKPPNVKTVTKTRSNPGLPVPVRTRSNLDKNVTERFSQTDILDKIDQKNTETIQVMLQANKKNSEKTHEFMNRVTILLENLATSKYTCQQCDIKFSSISELKEHVNIEHKKKLEYT